MQNCAYCKTLCKPSREHLWPSWALKKVPQYDARFSRRANKVFKGDMLIKDVCQACNNGALSSLDAYVASLWDAYFSRFVLAGESVEFAFDYARLLRWLLKMAYNSARANRDAAVELLRDYVPFILTGAPVPTEINLLAFLVKPAIVNGNRVFPQSLRCARLGFVGKDFNWCHTCLIGLQSYYFIVLIPKGGTFNPREINEHVRGILQMGTIPLTVESPVTLPPGRLDTKQMHHQHMLERGPEYLRFAAKHGTKANPNDFFHTGISILPPGE